jgi:hypothetical protein
MHVLVAAAGSRVQTVHRPLVRYTYKSLLWKAASASQLLISTCQSLMAEEGALDVIGREVVQQFSHLNIGRFPLRPLECKKMTPRVSPATVEN